MEDATTKLNILYVIIEESHYTLNSITKSIKSHDYSYNLALKLHKMS